jgi:hypothetical protein
MLISQVFQNLNLYFDIFCKKSKQVMEQMIKSGVVEDTHDFFQALALDVLGLSIFSYDFEALSMKSNKYLDSYNYLVHRFLTPTEGITAIFTHQIPFLNSTVKLKEQLVIWNELLEKLTKESFEKVKKGGIKEYSMIDMLIENSMSNEEEEKLTEKELRDNVKFNQF